MGALDFFRKQRKTVTAIEGSFSDQQSRSFVDENGDGMIGPAFVDGVSVDLLPAKFNQFKFLIEVIGEKQNAYRVSLLDPCDSISQEEIISSLNHIAQILDSEKLIMRTQPGIFPADRIFLTKI